MTFMMFFLLLGLVLGMIGVASNPSPYFAAFGLVVTAVVGGGVLVEHGGSFLALVLLLIYLGGMLVVFAYSAALAAEPYPETWGSGPIVITTGAYLLGVLTISIFCWEKWFEASWVPVNELAGFFMLGGDTEGVALMYSVGGGMLLMGAGVLLLTLFVVLELTRGLARGTLRAV